MLTYDQIKTLAAANLTNDQFNAISSLFAEVATTPAASAPTPSLQDPAPTAAPTPDPTPTPAPDPAPDPIQTAAATGTSAPGSAAAATTPPAESETVQLLREMLGLIQKNNINSLGGTPPAAETADAILAKIINPN